MRGATLRDDDADAMAALADGHFAVEVDGEYAGGIGYERLAAERRTTAEIGYRLEAPVFSNNARSARVLEKCGFVRS